ncbi:MAG: NfeD family protein [Phycisphaerales bacterium]|nr:NfeD family protein [Phycisphaerales bacterium]
MDILFANGASWFTVPAIVATIYFCLRMGLMFMGAGGFDADADVDIDADLDIDTADGDASTEAFTFFSLQAIAAFLMGFGWGGFASMLSFDGRFMTSLVVGMAVGVFNWFLMGWLTRYLLHLQSSGNISISDAVGQEGKVYLSVPAEGKGLGRVTVVIGSTQRTYDARTEGDAISSGTRVVVKGITANTLIVTSA